jgi:hypothetical protein
MNLEAIPRQPILCVQNAGGAKADQKLSRKTDHQSRCAPLANYSVLLGAFGNEADRYTSLVEDRRSRHAADDGFGQVFNQQRASKAARSADNQMPIERNKRRDAGAGISQSMAPPTFKGLRDARNVS